MNLQTLSSGILASESYMSSNTKFLHELTMDVASWSMYILELLSIFIIVFTTLVAFFKLFRHERYAKVYLLHGQSLGLSFKLGAEILRTVTATSLLEIFEVLLLILIKACMVALIERELRSVDEEDFAHPENPERTLPKQHLGVKTERRTKKAAQSSQSAESPKTDHGLFE
ncbi:DUF1622 domain-containing protein [Erysipelotrichaceae bacterium RD49]|nr:DUF1622 domain-containing protein [Erysipelotrichaceae bacterium RD49]